MNEADRKQGKRATVACDPDMAGGKQMPAFVVEQVRRRAHRESGPADVLFVVTVLLTEGGQRALQSRCARAVAVAEAEAETVDEHVHSTPGTNRRGRSASSLGHT